MDSTAGPVVTKDFRSLDFDGLWAGRGNTTSVERAVLASLLEGVDSRRILEVGPGEGRLTPVLRERAKEYVAIDLHSEFLGKLRWTDGPTRSIRAVADAHHAPFVAGSFTAIVVVRVYNFLPDALAFLGEMFRLLVPGGHVILGYQPHPSLATLVDDYRLFLRGGREPGMPSMTFSRRSQVSAHPSPFPAWLPSRKFVRSTLERSGFLVESALSTGIEDYVFGRWLPPPIFIRCARLGDRLGFLPTQFILAKKPAPNPAAELPGWSEMLGCAACRIPFGKIDLDEARELQCASCGARIRVRTGWVEARSDSETAA